MAVNSKIEEVVKTVSNTIGELHSSINGAIGDESTPGTSVFEINNLLSIAENGIPYLGVIETAPLSFETSYNPADGDYVVNSGGQIGYLGNVITVPSQRIGIKKYFSSTYPSTHVYGIVIAVSHTELETASSSVNATVSEQANISATKIKLDVIPSNLTYPVKAYIGTKLYLFTGVESSTYLNIDTTFSTVSSIIYKNTPISFVIEPRIKSISGPAVSTASLYPADFKYFPVVPDNHVELCKIVVENPNDPTITNTYQILRTALDMPNADSSTAILGDSEDRSKVLSACSNALQDLNSLKNIAGVNTLIQSLINFTKAKSGSQVSFKRFWNLQPFRPTSLYNIGRSFNGLERFDFDTKFTKAFFDENESDLVHTFAIFRGDLYDSTSPVMTGSTISNLALTSHSTTSDYSTITTGTYIYGVSTITNTGETAVVKNSIISKSSDTDYFMNEMSWDGSSNARFYHVYRRSTNATESIDYRLTPVNRIQGPPKFSNATITPTTPYTLANTYLAMKFIPTNSSLSNGDKVYCGGVRLQIHRSATTLTNPNAGFEINICPDAGGEPNTDFPVTQTANLKFGSISTTSAYYSVAFPNGANLLVGTTYWIVIKVPVAATPSTSFYFGSITSGTNLVYTTNDPFNSFWTAASNRTIYYKPLGFIDNGIAPTKTITRGVKLTEDIAHIPSRLSVYVPPVETLSNSGLPSYNLQGELVTSTIQETFTKNELVVTVIARNGENGTPKSLSITVPKNTARDTRFLLGTSTDLFDRVDEVYVNPGTNLTLFTSGLVNWSIYDLITVETVP